MMTCSDDPMTLPYSTGAAPGSEAPLDPHELGVRSLQVMIDGTLRDFERLVHPRAVNWEAEDEPQECAQPGPAGFLATALWLRAAFSELRFDVREVVVDGDLVVVHNTMSGRHTGPMVMYRDGRVAQVMPPTGRRFTSTQSHWLRVRDGKVIEHWANRDDIGTAQQLAWVPPTPLFLLRSALATRRARWSASRKRVGAEFERR